MFRATDDFLIDRIYQCIADWMQGLFGVNNFALARACCYIGVVMFLVSTVIQRRVDPIFGTIITMTMLIEWRTLFINEQKVLDQLSLQCRNPLRVNKYRTRFLFLALLFASMLLDIPWFFLVDFSQYWLRAVTENLLYALLCSIEYLSACELRPPSKSRAKQWLEGLMASRRFVSHPT